MRPATTVGCLFGLLVGGCCGRAAVGPEGTVEELAAPRNLIAVFGDTQRTLLVERLFFWREQNDVERERVIAAVAADRPDLLVHLGDAVDDGSSAGSWAGYDQLMRPVTDAGIPVLLALGNHDYWGCPTRAVEHAAARFAPLKGGAHWYARRYGRLLLVWLDTNDGAIRPEDWARQARWFAATLAAADADPAVRGVLVFAHHPPFTNSRVTSDERHVQAAFLGPFNAARKSLAFFAGHAHAYERFEKGGKSFIVSGGAGGPRVKLLTGDAAHHADRCTLPSPRPFHYLLLDVGERAITVRARGFDKGAAGVETIDQFELAWPG